jgi:hypothetical protein
MGLPVEIAKVMAVNREGVAMQDRCSTHECYKKTGDRQTVYREPWRGRPFTNVYA